LTTKDNRYTIEVPWRGKTIVRLLSTTRIIKLITTVTAGLVFVTFSGPALADQFDVQIQALQQQANQDAATASTYQAQAQTYQQEVAQLNAQITVIEDNVAITNAQLAQLQASITQSEASIATDKATLAENIKQMYLNDNQSALEVLMSSNSLSDYFNQQEYSDKVKSSITTTMAAVQAEEAELQTQQTTATQDLANEQAQQAEADNKRAQANALLATAQQSEAAANSQVQSSNQQIASLRAQQAAAMIAQFGGTAGTGPACGGGYPAKWCQVPQDSVVDSWGMYNRECVSYTAWAMAARGYYVPYDMGNANQWPSAAAAAGIPVNSTPSVGSVAIWYVGAYGHAMVVEAVDGPNITVSQYNYGEEGTYSVMTVPSSGFTYIHFR
jgi:surface antigen